MILEQIVFIDFSWHVVVIFGTKSYIPLISAYICQFCINPLFSPISQGQLPLTQRMKWQPTPVVLPGESHRRGAWQATVHGVTRVGHDLATKPPSP